MRSIRQILNVGLAKMDINKEKFMSNEVPEEFENGWDINVGSFLRMALGPGSVWTIKSVGASGYYPVLTIHEFLSKNNVVCEFVDGGRVTKTINYLVAHYNPPSIDFEYVGPIEYGATCEKCNRSFEYQKKSAGFECWACKNGY